MGTTAISASTTPRFGGAHMLAGNESGGQHFGILDRLPAEILDHIVRSDPDSTLRLMDTSHQMESFIVGTVLQSLYDKLGGSIARTRRFIQAALKRGKTARQIVLLSSLLTDRDVGVRGRRLVQIGMLNIRSHNALCSELINLLCHPDVALYAFELDFPLLGTDDLRCRRRLIGKVPPPSGSKIEYIDGKRVYVNGLDKVFLHFSDWFKEANMPSLFGAQYNHSLAPSHPLILPSDSEVFAVDAIDYSDLSDSHIRMVASVDAGSLALSMERYMSADILRRMNKKAPPGQSGVLYAAMFGGNGPTKSIKTAMLTPIGPYHQWGREMFPASPSRSSGKSEPTDRRLKAQSDCILL